MFASGVETVAITLLGYFQNFKNNKAKRNNSTTPTTIFMTIITKEYRHVKECLNMIKLPGDEGLEGGGLSAPSLPLGSLLLGAVVV